MRRTLAGLIVMAGLAVVPASTASADPAPVTGSLKGALVLHCSQWGTFGTPVGGVAVLTPKGTSRGPTDPETCISGTEGP